MHRVILSVAALAAITTAGVVQAQDGRGLAAGCATCHGITGASPAFGRPLRSMSRDELVQRLQDFRSGKQPGTLMPQLAKGYSDAEIDALATWFAARSTAR